MSPTARALLEWLDEELPDGGTVDLSAAQIGGQLGCSVRSVRRAVDQLQYIGFVERERAERYNAGGAGWLVLRFVP